MEYKLHGTVMQTLEITIGPSEMVYCQTHALAYMSDAIQMNTSTGGGIWKSIVRTFSGGSLFRNEFTSNAPGGLLGFCPRFPGKIVPYKLAPGESLICRKETFLCAEGSVQFEIFFRQQLGGGLFGGEGFILQKVTGPGTVFLDLSGEVVEKILAPGERLRVHVGHVGVQDPSVQFGVQIVKGFKNLLFGGEGIFFATLTGPGRVLLQSMPIVNLADEIMRYAGGTGGGARQPETGIDVGVSVLKGILDRDN